LKLKKKSFHTELHQHLFSERINLWDRDCYSFVFKQFQDYLLRLRKHNEDRSRVGQVIMPLDLRGRASSP